MSKLHLWRAVDAFGEHYWHVAPDDKWQYSYLTRMNLPRFQDWKDAIKWALHLYSIGEKPVNDRRTQNHDPDWPCLTCNRASMDCCGPWETPQEHEHN